MTVNPTFWVIMPSFVFNRRSIIEGIGFRLSAHPSKSRWSTKRSLPGQIKLSPKAIRSREPQATPQWLKWDGCFLACSLVTAHTHTGQVVGMGSVSQHPAAECNLSVLWRMLTAPGIASTTYTSYKGHLLIRWYESDFLWVISKIKCKKYTAESALFMLKSDTISGSMMRKRRAAVLADLDITQIKSTAFTGVFSPCV